MKIAIDFGHGVGQDRGAIGFIAEEGIINAVGALVLAKLVTLGHEVIEVRPKNATSVSDSLEQRCQKADNNNVDLFVSLHANAGGGIGTEVYTYNAKEVPEARAVLNNIVALGFTNRGIKDGSGLYVVKHPSATAMLIEICFCDTQSDVDKYNSVGAEAIANAIVSGLTGQAVQDTIKNSNGIWKQDDKGFWYVNSDGTYPQSKWFQVENDWYYADEKGYCYQNRWLKYKYKWYYFKNDCKMATNEIIIYKFNEQGEWIEC